MNGKGFNTLFFIAFARISASLLEVSVRGMHIAGKSLRIVPCQ
jgi:hypothetical protein